MIAIYIVPGPLQSCRWTHPSLSTPNFSLLERTPTSPTGKRSVSQTNSTTVVHILQTTHPTELQLQASPSMPVLNATQTPAPPDVRPCLPPAFCLMPPSTDARPPRHAQQQTSGELPILFPASGKVAPPSQLPECQSGRSSLRPHPQPAACALQSQLRATFSRHTTSPRAWAALIASWLLSSFNQLSPQQPSHLFFCPPICVLFKKYSRSNHCSA